MLTVIIDFEIFGEIAWEYSNRFAEMLVKSSFKFK